MEITIQIPKLIEIPDERIPDIIANIKEIYGVPEFGFLYSDLLEGAERLGVIEIPDDWSIQASDELQLTEEEIYEEIGMDKKSKKIRTRNRGLK